MYLPSIPGVRCTQISTLRYRSRDNRLATWHTNGDACSRVSPRPHSPCLPFCAQHPASTKPSTARQIPFTKQTRSPILHSQCSTEYFRAIKYQHHGLILHEDMLCNHTSNNRPTVSTPILHVSNSCIVTRHERHANGTFQPNTHLPYSFQRIRYRSHVTSSYRRPGLETKLATRYQSGRVNGCSACRRSKIKGSVCSKN